MLKRFRLFAVLALVFALAVPAAVADSATFYRGSNAVTYTLDEVGNISSEEVRSNGEFRRSVIAADGSRSLMQSPNFDDPVAISYCDGDPVCEELALAEELPGGGFNPGAPGSPTCSGGYNCDRCFSPGGVGPYPQGGGTCALATCSKTLVGCLACVFDKYGTVNPSLLVEFELRLCFQTYGY